MPLWHHPVISTIVPVRCAVVTLDTSRLQEDHANALRLGTVLQRLPFVAGVAPIETNIVIFTVAEGHDPQQVSVSRDGWCLCSTLPG